MDVLDKYIDAFKERFAKLPFIKAFRGKVILRKVIIFLTLFSMWLSLLAGALFSPKRITYGKQQLATSKSFENQSGKIELTKQVYSADNQILLLQMETQDYTGVIAKGINAKNLKWKLYAKKYSEKTRMEIIPLTNNKITLVIQNLPDDFEAIALEVENTTPTGSDVDISIKSYDEESKKKTKVKELSNKMLFIVTAQNQKMEEKKLKYVSRESFSLDIFKEERAFQVKQIEQMKKSIEKLEESIKEDQSTLENLTREAEYKVGSDLEVINNNMTQIKTSMNTKGLNIKQAENNIATLEEVVASIDKAIEAVKDGSYQFNAPVTSFNIKEIQ